MAANEIPGALRVELRTALLAEFGARAIYGDLARLTGDEELRGVLARLVEEEDAQLARLRSLMGELGLDPARRSRRRRLLAWVFSRTAHVAGVPFVLRTCVAAEGKAARWYGHFVEYFLGAGQRAHAELCRQLSVTKQRHSQVLDTWAQNAPRRDRRSR